MNKYRKEIKDANEKEKDNINIQKAKVMYMAEENAIRYKNKSIK